jgi:hypothetical protein
MRGLTVADAKQLASALAELGAIRRRREAERDAERTRALCERDPEAFNAGVLEGRRQAREVFEDYCRDFTVGDWDAIDAKFEEADRG